MRKMWFWGQPHAVVICPYPPRGAPTGEPARGRQGARRSRPQWSQGRTRDRAGAGTQARAAQEGQGLGGYAAALRACVRGVGARLGSAGALGGGWVAWRGRCGRGGVGGASVGVGGSGRHSPTGWVSKLSDNSHNFRGVPFLGHASQTHFKAILGGLGSLWHYSPPRKLSLICLQFEVTL